MFACGYDYDFRGLKLFETLHLLVLATTTSLGLETISKPH